MIAMHQRRVGSKWDISTHFSTTIQLIDADLLVASANTGVFCVDYDEPSVGLVRRILDLNAPNCKIRVAVWMDYALQQESLLTRWQYQLPHHPLLEIHPVHSHDEFVLYVKSISTQIDMAAHIQGQLELFCAAQWQLLPLREHDCYCLQERLGTMAGVARASLDDLIGCSLDAASANRVYLVTNEQVAAFPACGRACSARSFRCTSSFCWKSSASHSRAKTCFTGTSAQGSPTTCSRWASAILKPSSTICDAARSSWTRSSRPK